MQVLSTSEGFKFAIVTTKSGLIMLLILQLNNQIIDTIELDSSRWTEEVYFTSIKLKLLERNAALLEADTGDPVLFIQKRFSPLSASLFY